MLIGVLVLLGLGHVAADWILQPGELAAFKRLPDLWGRWRWLAVHGAVHGFMVALVLGPVYGLAEAIAHAAIDRGKGRGWYGETIDQAMHAACKLGWVALWCLT